MEKVRYETGAEAVFASAKIAEAKGCEMTSTCLWVGVQKDDEGYFIEVETDDLQYL